MNKLMGCMLSGVLMATAMGVAVAKPSACSMLNKDLAHSNFPSADTDWNKATLKKAVKQLHAWVSVAPNSTIDESPTPLTNAKLADYLSAQNHVSLSCESLSVPANQKQDYPYGLASVAMSGDQTALANPLIIDPAPNQDNV